MSEDVGGYMSPRWHEGGEPHRHLWLHKVSHWPNFVPASPNTYISEELDLVKVLEDVLLQKDRQMLCFTNIKIYIIQLDSSVLYRISL